MVFRKLKKKVADLVGTYEMLYRPQSFWEKRFRQEFSLRASGHGGLSEKENVELYQLKAKIIEELLKGWAVQLEERRVLEVGCGTGFWTAFCHERGVKSYVGVDLTEVSVSTLATLYPAYRFFRLDAARNPLPEGPFDLIFCIDVCQHVRKTDEFQNVLEGMRRALPEGGHLLITGWYLPGYTMHYGDVDWGQEAYEAIYPASEWIEVVDFNDKALCLIQKSGRE